VSPEEVKKKIDIYRSAVRGCTRPIGHWVHDRAATFTMALCAPTEQEAWSVARRSFEWYPKAGARQIATLADWMAEERRELGNYAYAGEMRKIDKSGALDLLTLEYLVGAGACVLGTPPQCLDTCKRYQAAGVDLLLCLVNPYEIPHEKVMQTIELIGRDVIPHFRA
jgi:alkanesulfonate monooxygenase SsuD/methylene tetrahydromethanopterin reductase-like flavin-dependent oxidoreductase (luciferase family)